MRAKVTALESLMLFVGCSIAFGLGGCGDLLPGVPPPLTPQPSDPSFPEEPDPTDPGEPDPFDPDIITVTAVEPDEGPTAGGVDVMLSGIGFRDGLEVFFGEAPAPDVFVIGPTIAIVRLPPRAAGRVDVTATHIDAKIQGLLSLSFRFFETIVVTSVDPAEGPSDGGPPVVVKGRGFTADTRFFIGGRPGLDQRVLDGETLSGISPPGPFGWADVHAVGFNGTGTLADAFHFAKAPILMRISPVVGPAAGGTTVTLEGEGLGDEAVVLFGDNEAEVVAASRDGTRVTVLTPAREDVSETTVVDVSVATSSGSSTLSHAFGYRADAIDPLQLACSHLAPAIGSAGDAVELACTGLAYGGIQVRFGTTPAVTNSIDVAGSRLVVAAPTGSGTTPVEVKTAAADWVQAGNFTYRAAAPVAVDNVTPASGPTTGGTTVTIRGRGFGSGTSVQIGVLAATSVTIIDDTTLTAITPPGVPGGADVIVRSSGIEARLRNGFDYRSDVLGLDLIAPAEAARSGGTWLRVYGDGFGGATEVRIGGVTCDVIVRVSSAELAVRSPKLEVGVYAAEVIDGDQIDTLDNALVVFDPRSGTGGTRGGTIDETLNVTVWGSGGYGAVSGAFVLVGSDPEGPWRGITDENGQVTISGPGLYGPVEVTASRDGFTAYSVLVFDAVNVTVLLTQNPTPPTPGGGGTPVTPLPNAVLAGKVFGLDKYVIAPPASCAAKAIPETLHCAECDPAAVDGGCDATPGFACIDIGDQGPHCVAECSTNVVGGEALPTPIEGGCPAGYACAGTTQGARCLPSPGIKRAYCNVSAPSLFGYEYPLQPTGWVDADNNWSLDSRRLGELAIYCFGGYQDESGIFTPTVMGVVRNFFAPPGGNIKDIEVELSHPLRRSFRLRLQDPPTWPTGLADPTVAISLDLGPDGVIPFSRALVPVGDNTFVAPHQLASLGEELYNATYFLYTTLAPAGVTGYQPRSYNLVQNVQSIVEDRLPVRDDNGWRLDGSQIQRDLRAIWAVPEAEAEAGGTRAWAVGEAGAILLWNGNGWSSQASFTDKTLYAVSGVNGSDVWAAGEDGAMRHWDGLAWQTVAAPEDDYEAVFADADFVYAAGSIRLRKLDRATGIWSLEGAPAVQGARALLRAGDGRILALGTGRIFASTASPDWSAIATPPDVTLRAGMVRANGELVVIGDRGTLLVGATPESLVAVPVPTTHDLTALTEETDGTLVVVGDNGVALRGLNVQTLRLEVIPDYRSKAYGVVVTDGEVHVVGSAAFILGPFLHFPVVTAPVHEASLESLAFAWTWEGGPANQYTRLALTPDASITVWTLIVDGAQQLALLPDLQAAAGLAPLAPGRYRLDVLRVLNRDFEIDNFTTRDFNLYARDSWATNEAYFFLP